MNTDIVVLTDKAIGVKTSGIFYNFRLPKSEPLQGKLYASGGYNGHSWILPEGSWTLLGLAKDLTEEDWKKVVSWFELAGKTGYRDYHYDDPRFPYETASISGLSLLWEYRLDPSTTVILIKQ